MLVDFTQLIRSYLTTDCNLNHSVLEIDLISINTISNNLVFDLTINASDYMLFKENIKLKYNEVIKFLDNKRIKITNIIFNLQKSLDDKYKPAMTPILMECDNENTN
jgi:hypothetical protein